VLAFRLQRTDAVIDVAWSRTHGTPEHDRGGRVCGTIGHRERVCMDLQAAVERARLVHG